MKKIFTLLSLVYCSYAATAQVEYTMQMSFQDTTRSFVVHLPPAYTPGSHLPVVFNLHGLGSDGPQQNFYSKMHITSNTNGFIAVFPNGLNNSWNSYSLLPHHSSFPDDVGFISKIIDTLYQLYSIDLRRVYCCGMSNGGFQSYRIACELSHRIAAIASVTGSMTDSIAYYCNISHKMPVLQIHGTMDPLVPYNGNAGIWPVEDVISFWLNKNQCLLSNDTVFTPNTNTTDSSTVQEIRYRTCADSAEVWFYKIIGGGHTWPNAPVPFIYGPTNKDIDGSQEIWDFFKKYTLDGPVGVEKINTEVEVNIIPNPGEDFVNVQAAQIISRVEVMDVTGRLIDSKQAAAATIQLDCTGWPSGIYVVQLHTVSGITTGKFFKK